MTQAKRSQGMILAAGLGTRLRPLTLSRPKPLMEVIGQPLIEYVLQHMHRAGVERVVINTHYLGQHIVDAVGPNFRGIPIHYLYEEQILGTGGALKNARELLEPSGQSVLLMNGDIFIDLDLDDLFRIYEQKKALALLMLKTVADPKVWGAIGTDRAGQVRTLVNYVPYEGYPLLERMFCGTHLLSPEIWHAFPALEAFSIIDAVYAPLVHGGKRIMGLEQRGYYGDIGTPEALFQVNMDILSGKIKFTCHDFFARFSQRPAEKNSPGSIWLGRDVEVSDRATIVGPAVIDDGARIDAGAIVGPYAMIGKDVVVEKNAEVVSCVVMSGTTIVPYRVCRQMLVDKEHCVQINTFR